MPGTSASFSVCSLVVERVKAKLGGDSQGESLPL